MLKPRKIPAKLGTVIDLLYTSRAKRLKEQHRVDDMKTFETTLREHLIRTLPKSEASGIAGRLARAQVTTRDVPQVDDWEKFFAYVARTKSWDLLQRRVSPEAVVERWEAGKEIPGVGRFTLTDVSVRKL